MKVCFVTSSFIRHSQDGYARFVYEQAKSLLRTRRNYEVVVVAPHAPGLARCEVIDGLNIHRFRYFLPTSLQRLAYRHEGLFNTLKSSRLALVQLPFFLLSMLFVLWRQSRGASIIHAQWIPTALAAIPVGRIRGIPVCVSARGADVNTCRLSRLGDRLSRFVLNHVDSVLTVSAEFQQALQALKIKAQVHAVYNGVDTKLFHPRDAGLCKRQLDIPPEFRLILYVGGLIPRKGISTLFKAFARVKSRLPSESRLCLAGEGPLQSALEKEAFRLGIAEQVMFVGRINRNEVSLWMSASEILVLPSESEGRPNVVLEAMGAGIPVIATAVNGTVEIIRSGCNGLLFRPGDDATLAEHLNNLFQHSDKARALVAEGHATLERESLSWESHGQQIDEIYIKLIG